jgi:hypothetical protein
MQNWWMLPVVGLLGCNAVFGLDERTFVDGVSATDSGNLAGSGSSSGGDSEAVSDSGSQSGSITIPDSAVLQVADATDSAMTDASAPEDAVPNDALDAGCSSGCSGSEDAGPGNDAREDTGAPDGGPDGGPDGATPITNCNAAESVCCSTGCINGSGLMQCGGTGCGSLPGGVNACCSSGIDGTQPYCNASISNAPCRLRT